jgi:hypothetical protein
MIVFLQKIEYNNNMNLIKYLITMSVASVASVFVWVYILININPESTNIVGFILFYASLSLSLIGLFSLIGFWIRKLVLKKEVEFRHIYNSFRQAIFLTLIFVLVLILQSQRLFNFANISLLIITLVALELFIISRKVA